MRFWEFSSGEILINGEDYRRYENDVLRKMIAYVPQDNFIFNGTVAENIRIGKPSSTMAEVIQAAQKANIHEFILTLPKGYQTYVGEMGAFLSGGQRQKLSIARAAIRDVPIYLLDEPFSNLDQSTEKSVHISIMRMVHGKSLILITHRIANLTGMDEIIVLQNGFIIERGTEEELISMDGQYKKMLKLQNDLIIDPNTGV
ncbi:MAG: ATP-binding cassette domain-containing protein, partial [Gammaproteobacteria bacterium]|nr:ATP-binding cassette domain-containing protein [Gammaproteobacteria bacterium]